MTVTVYTKTACQQCRMTERLLDREGVSYVTADATDPTNLEYLKGLGHMSAPVVITDTDSWAGFVPEKIKAIKENQ